ncbi:hypothetical protein Ddye_001924 [Dipteronia dyeriana]|uniref:DUF4283 domain-containing protein n=1 Tax=Dipteronia dyeriana TaxID=168575 RepID=A0AAD9XQ62_9ROSI|nr:hypothetical protein Ddye_001924 [Dipteronia dyeriana]
MVFLPIHCLTEDPMSLEVSLFSSAQSSSITALNCGKRTVSSNSKGCSLGNVLTTISSLGDQSVTVGDSTQLPVMNSNPLSGGKSYVDLLKTPEVSVQSFPLTFMLLKKGGFVSIRVDPVVYQSRLQLCKNALIGRVALSSGERLESLLTSRLSLIILKSPRDNNKVWGLGSINLKPRVLRLQPWVPDFNPSLQKSTNAYVWVRFYDLSWEYCHLKIIFYLSKGIRVPLRLDKATINGDFVHHARVLVDVDMSALLPSSVLLERDEIHSSFILVDYENFRSFCSICSSICHLPSYCRWNKSKVPTASVGKSSQSMAEVSVEDTTFQPVRSRSSKMVYCPIDKTVQEVPVFNAFAAIYQDFGPIEPVVVHQSVSLGPSFV